MANRIQLYTSDYCGFCVAAKRLLTERGVPYTEISLNDPADRQAAAAKWNWQTVPIVVIDEVAIGGYTELAAVDKSQGLAQYK